jgi:hypothetical protein
MGCVGSSIGKIVTNVALFADMKEHFVIDPLISKRQQLLLATQLCRMVLKVCIVFLVFRYMPVKPSLFSSRLCDLVLRRLPYTTALVQSPCRGSGEAGKQDGGRTGAACMLALLLHTTNAASTVSPAVFFTTLPNY